MTEKDRLDKLIKQFGDFEKKLFHEMSHSHLDNATVQAYLLESEKIHQALNQLANRLRMGEHQTGRMFAHDNKHEQGWKSLFGTINNVLHHIKKEMNALEKIYANQKEFTFHSAHFDDFKYKLALRNELLKMQKELHDQHDTPPLMDVKEMKR